MRNMIWMFHIYIVSCQGVVHKRRHWKRGKMWRLYQKRGDINKCKKLIYGQPLCKNRLPKRLNLPVQMGSENGSYLQWASRRGRGFEFPKLCCTWGQFYDQQQFLFCRYWLLCKSNVKLSNLFVEVMHKIVTWDKNHHPREAERRSGDFHRHLCNGHSHTSPKTWVTFCDTFLMIYSIPITWIIPDTKSKMVIFGGHFIIYEVQNFFVLVWSIKIGLILKTKMWTPCSKIQCRTDTIYCKLIWNWVYFQQLIKCITKLDI